MASKIQGSTLLAIATACGLSDMLPDREKELSEFAEMLTMMERGRCSKIFDNQAQQLEEQAEALRSIATTILKA